MNKNNIGWIAEIGSENYHHLFGGNKWIVNDDRAIAGGPSLILTLDLADPSLEQISKGILPSLPICSYINCDLWIEPQQYKIDIESNLVSLIRRSDSYTTILDEGIRYSNPLIEKRLKLRKMNETEIFYDENSYWNACDSFIGGSSFIRILGEPLWLQKSESPICVCEREQKYVCCIGYDYAHHSGLIDEQPFFIGEAALYFFLCFDCLILSVLSQST